MQLRTLALVCAFASMACLLPAQTALNFLPVVPCRVVDTRQATGPFGGPSLGKAGVRNFPVLSSPCGIPSNASAYSFNLTVVPPGPLAYVTIWPTGSAQPFTSNINAWSGQVIANTVLVGAGTNGSVSVFASNPTDIVLDINGYFVAATNSQGGQANNNTVPETDSGIENTGFGFNALAVNDGASNTGLGYYALSANSTGNNNVAVGATALMWNAAGSANTAVGVQALEHNLANDDTAVGFGALWYNTLGPNNTAVGVSALFNNGLSGNNTAIGMNALYGNTAGSDNTAIGFGTLYTDATGHQNVAVGSSALYASTGSSNIAVGYQAGNQATSGNMNIFIGNEGQANDTNVIRIGAAPNQTSTFIAGITGVNVSGVPVLVDINGQLGVASSSERFKQDIQAMGEASSRIMDLRPVTFRYKQPDSEGKQPLQYGFIGEQVAKIYPELVVYDRSGQVESLKYHEFPALLLNELQKQEKTIRELQARVAALEAELETRSNR